MAAGEWTNYGDMDVTKGATLIRSDTESSNTFDFFRVMHRTVDGEPELFAYTGQIVNIDFCDYADTLEYLASENGYSNAVEFAEAEPERAVADLIEEFGMKEFPAKNKDGQGVYSDRLDDFHVTEQELAEFMGKCDIPAELIPEYRYAVTARYGKAGIESTFESDSFSKVQMFAHEKLMDGLNVEIQDTQTGKSVILDADRYQDTFDLRNGEFPVAADNFTPDYGDEGREL